MVSEISEFGSAYANEQLRRSRHPLRRLIKKFYLDRVLRELRGPTIDFGCGAGQLLARLPADSVGLEVNPHLVQASSMRSTRSLRAVSKETSFIGCGPSVLAKQSFIVALAPLHGQ